MYPESFKSKAVKMYESGTSLREIADQIGSSPASISRWLKGRGVLPTSGRKKSKVKFWEKINKNTNKLSPYAAGQCWEWEAAKTPAGYGRLWNGERYEYAHRHSWKIHNKGAIPDGLFIMHKCDNPSCVRPSHLAIGTPSENSLDSVKKGRWRYAKKD